MLEVRRKSRKWGFKMFYRTSIVTDTLKIIDVENVDGDRIAVIGVCGDKVEVEPIDKLSRLDYKRIARHFNVTVPSFF
jgi:hypothetical protein